MTIEQLNAADRAGFVRAVGFTFESSPWIADAAWERRPFANADALHTAMLAAAEAAPLEQRIALIQAHPELGGQAAREGHLEAASSREQAAVGLDRLASPEAARFDELNAAYRERFGFPFVICACEHTKVSILTALERRLASDRAAEIEVAVVEIGKIARLRLRNMIVE